MESKINKAIPWNCAPAFGQLEPVCICADLGVSCFGAVVSAWGSWSFSPWLRRLGQKGEMPTK